jgi:hypothetical protein
MTFKRVVAEPCQKNNQIAFCGFKAFAVRKGTKRELRRRCVGETEVIERCTITVRFKLMRRCSSYHAHRPHWVEYACPHALVDRLPLHID